MIIYEREKKTLIIPTGIGNGNIGSGDYADGFEAGRAAQKAADDRKITPTTAITQNGEYEANYGFKKVIVDVECGDCSEEVEEAYESGQTAGYNSGYTAGEAAQKAKLGSISITNNGTYSRPDGYGTVEVQVEGGTCELENKPFNLESGTTFPATISPSDGYDGLSEVTVSDNGYGDKKYNDGFSDGQDSIRNNMSSTAFTQNGIFTNSSGWSSVTVNVPSSGGGSNLQNKSVVLTAGTQSVVPDAGFDGMTKVDVDATDLLSDERTSGYSDGYSQGVDDVRNQFTTTAVTQNGTYTMSGVAAFSSFTVNVEETPQLQITSYNLDEYWGGESGEVYPDASLGFVGWRYFMVNDIGYGQKKYDDGYADGILSGHTEGYEDALSACGGSYIWYESSDESAVTISSYNAYTTSGNAIQIEENVPVYSANGVLPPPPVNRYIGNRIVFSDVVKVVNKMIFSQPEKITKIFFPSSMTGFLEQFGTGEFEEYNRFGHLTSLTELTLPAEMLNVVGFNDCPNLKSVNLPMRMAIMRRAFTQSGIKEVNFPKSTGWIGSDSFRGSAVEKVIINGPCYIEHGAFRGDGGNWSGVTQTPSLQEIYIYSTVSPIFSSDAGGTIIDPTDTNAPFGGQPSGGTIYVPTGYAGIYQNWLNYLPGWTISDTL